MDDDPGPTLRPFHGAMSKLPRILINAEIHPEGLKLLQDAGYECICVPESNPAASFAAVADAVGMVANASLKIDDAFLARAPGLRAVGRMGVGYDNVDVEAARRRGVRVLNTPLPVIEPVAEHTLLLMLAVARRLVVGDRAVREGRWREPGNLPGPELRGKALGLIGLGNTGRRVAEIAVRGFEMRAAYFDKTARPEAERDLGIERLALDDLLTRSDFVTVHVNLSPETRGLIDRRAFARMKPGAVLVNVSRGPVVDEEALVDALREGRLGGAGLDVFAVEPPGKDNPLWSLPNVVTAPHVGGASAESKRGCSMVVLDIIRVLRGETPVHAVV
jgi:phosphoglycerate dehydrogenase-like enzyme